MAHDDHPTISTKEELIQRLRHRRKPLVHAELTPTGETLREIARRNDGENERRIARLRNSLEDAGGNLDKQQSFARLGGFAAARFNRER